MCNGAQYSDIKWASRWDTYLNSADDDQIHWFSIINSVCIDTRTIPTIVSQEVFQQDVNDLAELPQCDATAQLLIVVFLTGMVAMIMMRTLNQDVRRYNQLEGDEVNWHADQC